MSFSSDPVISLKNASIYQEGQKVLHDISLSIDKGEFVYLLGKTGSGKSSLLKTLYADLAIQEGEVYVAGFAINKIKSKQVSSLRRKLGIIFQDFELFTDRSVYENLEFVLKATGWKNKPKTKARISEVLMRVGLDGSSSKMPHQLSGGEQQRIVIARALLNEPVLLLADEPTGNLDPETAEDILKLFQSINISGTAILMASHNHTLIEKYPCRSITCADGTIIDSTSKNDSTTIHSDSSL